MLSVRITAAGAVFVCCLAFSTAPARACDDRYFNKCEKAAAAAAGDESAAPARHARRVKIVAASRARHGRFARHRQAPRFAANLPRRERDESAEPAAPSDSPMARRFRGFIDPQPISQNAFEHMRKPHVMPLDFDTAAAMPVIDLADTALPPAPAAANPPPAPEPASAATVTTTAKQDRLVAKPVALKPAAPKPDAFMELASAESRPVTLPPVPAPAAAPARAAAAPTIVTEAPPADPQKGNFSFHGLVLALCGALGAASALRFIVGA
jgi:hypothetical protein